MSGRVILFLALGLGLASAKASRREWGALVYENGNFRTKSSNLALTVTLEGAGGQARLLSWKPSPNNPDLWVLEYYSGEAGTSTIVEVYRQQVIQVSARRVLADRPLRYVFKGAKTSRKVNVEWKWTPNLLTIRDPEFPEENMDLPFPPPPPGKVNGTKKK